MMRYGNHDAQYEGQWTRDVKHGYGSYKFPSGAQYVGQWYEGKMHGQGTYNYADGQRFHGEMDRNLKSGHGTHVYTNKDQWHGIWDKDQPHGTGLYVYNQDQTKVECPFIKQGEQTPKVGKTGPALKLLRAEDKHRILDQGEDAGSKAEDKASQAAQESAKARALMCALVPPALAACSLPLPTMTDPLPNTGTKSYRTRRNCWGCSNSLRRGVTAGKPCANGRTCHSAAQAGRKPGAIVTPWHGRAGCWMLKCLHPSPLRR